MRKFLVRRAIFSILTMWGITIVVFSLSRAGPDPMLMFIQEETYGVSAETLEVLRAKWGLDKPLPVQYVVWVGRMFVGDFGRSIGARQPVTKLVREKIGATVQLGLGAWIMATAVGIPLGVLSAVKRGTLWDYLARFIALMGQATPSFWLAIVLILIFAVTLDLLPSAGRAANKAITTEIRHLILPTMVLAFEPWAIYLRLTRSSMLEVLDSEYIKLASAKGVGRWAIIWKHGLRNALIQPLTVSALVLASFFTGSVFVETVFAWPGLGRLAVEATWNNDFPLLSGVILFFGVLYVTLSFLADVLYAYIDPRIRYT